MKIKQDSKPLFVSTLAATGIKKLKLMLNEEAIFLKTRLDCLQIRKYLEETQNDPPEEPIHPAAVLPKPNEPVVYE